jgi:DNA-binding CsgD family transcriptional regulator
MLDRIRRVVPMDAVFFAGCDPSTLLFTDVVADDLLVRLTPQFLRNEFLEEDVNKFRAVAADPSHVMTLDAATSGHRAESARYREILDPAHLGDEMRVALTVGGVCWGFMCLHRERGSGFSQSDTVFLQSVARPIAEGMRAALLLARLSNPDSNQPGVVLLTDTRELQAATPAGLAFLEELTGAPNPGDLPIPVQTVAARLAARDAGHDGPPPTIRVLSRADRWLVIRATHLVEAPGPDRIAVIIEPARPDEFIPLMLRAHRLTPRETEVAVMVVSGRSTKEIGGQLRLSENSVQDHLKAVFEKVGVRSRRELTANLQGQVRATHRPNTLT